MLRNFCIATLLLASTASFAAKCDREYDDLKSKQARVSSKKTIRNVSGIIGIFFWPVWIVTGVEAVKVSSAKKEVRNAEANYRNCMAQP